MATSPAIQAATQKAAGLPVSTGQAAGLAATAATAAPPAAAPAATPDIQAQNQQALQALNSRMSMDQAVPQAFAQQQVANANAPYVLANQIAGSNAGANGGALGAIDAANSNYMSQLAAAKPMAYALANAQVAAAQKQYQYQQAQLAMQPQELQLQQQQLNQQQQQLAMQQKLYADNPELALSAGQQNQINNSLNNAEVQGISSGSGDYGKVDANTRDDFNRVISAVGSGGLPAAMQQIKSDDASGYNKKNNINTTALNNYLYQYYNPQTNYQPYVPAPAASAAPVVVAHPGGPSILTKVGNGIGNAFSSLSNGLKNPFGF